MMKTDGTYESLTKKEIALLEKELAKLKKNFGGIVAMERMPKAAFIVDTKKEDTAVREARKLGIPVIALIDTNSNPDLVDYPIPGNDDATKSIQAITGFLADSVIEGRKRFLSYLSHDGSAAKKEEPKEGEADVAAPGILPEEEVEIKEIEAIVEEGTKDDLKASKKSHTEQAATDKNKAKRKV